MHITVASDFVRRKVFSQDERRDRNSLLVASITIGEDLAGSSATNRRVD